MDRYKYLMRLGIYLLLPILTGWEVGAQPLDRIDTIFMMPPEEAKPRGYWLWPHGNFDYTRIRDELAEFRKMGLGGVDIFDMGIKDPLDQIPAGNPFMGTEMLDGIAYADGMATELGLTLGLSVSNGWNAGGPWTPPDERIMQLLFWKDTLRGPIQISQIGFPVLPNTFQKPYGSFPLFPEFDVDGFPIYYENVGLVAYPYSETGLIANAEDVIYFDQSLIRGNRIDIELPEGTWILTRAVVSPLGQKQWVRSDNTDGFIMDHYSKKATKNHFEYIITKLEDRMGNLKNRAIDRLYLASFEAEDYIIWSPEVKEHFEEQHGYMLDPYLPILAGQSMVDDNVTHRFLHDYRSTISEMFVNNHYRQGRSISNDHHLYLASESGGPGLPLHYVPTEDLKALGSVDIMRGEFWNKKSEYFDENGNDLLQVVRNIASAAHIYGHKIVEMESFTSHGKYWEERPVELKRLADRAFCEGMTRVVYHTMAHSPKEAGRPGWSYSAGTHISPKMAWWDLSKPFHDYMARTSALLQEGTFVADVAYYYGEQVPKFASGSKFVRPSLGRGYDYDDLNKEVLLQSTVTADGQLMLPSGMKYHLLVLPEDPEMSLEVIEKITDLLNQGASILGPAPKTVLGLKDWQVREASLREKAVDIWGDALARQERTYGMGRIFTGYEEKEILKSKNIHPDFLVSDQAVHLDYIHRRSEREDVYFVRNPDSVFVNTTIDLRVSDRRPYLFDPENGKISAVAYFRRKGGRTQIPLQLKPYGSIFLVFKTVKEMPKNITSIQLNGVPAPVTWAAFYGDDDQINFSPPQAGRYEIQFSDQTRRTLDVEMPTQRALAGPWRVHFPYGWGFDPIQSFDSLIDWRQHIDHDLSIFSGMATYQKNFTVDKAANNYYLDLGNVGIAARVYLNGVEVGTRVFGPYLFNVSGLIRTGANNLTVEVASTWINQLIGESQKPFHQARTNSNLANESSRDDEDWVRPWLESSTQASGLMGPVTLLEQIRLTLD